MRKGFSYGEARQQVMYGHEMRRKAWRGPADRRLTLDIIRDREARVCLVEGSPPERFEKYTPTDEDKEVVDWEFA